MTGSATVLGDLVARDRRSGAIALSVPGLVREYDYRRFCTTTWKFGNFLRHCGVHEGSTVAILESKPLQPEPLFAFFGTALLGATAEFFERGKKLSEARVVVRPVEHTVDSDLLSPGTKQIVYGGSPADCDPSVGSFERDVWSENPTEPPDRVTPDQPVLRASGETYTHADLIDAARAISDQDEQSADILPVRSLGEPETIAAGVTAPLLLGGSILLSETDGCANREHRCDIP